MKRISKLFIAFILLSLCTGCTINYNLEITSDTVKESIEVTDTVINDRNKTQILKEYQRWIPAYIDADNESATSYDSSVKNENYEISFSRLCMCYIENNNEAITILVRCYINMDCNGCQ